MEVAYKQDYYSVGSVDDIVISNSSLTQIDPNSGGSPQAFLEFFKEDVERKTSIQMDRGSLLHLWHEDEKRPEAEKQFVVEEMDKPSEMMAGWVERIHSSITSPGGLQLDCTDDVIVAARDGAYSNIKDQKKLLEKFESDGREYFNFLKQANGKICISKETRRILDGQISSILGNGAAHRTLFGEMPPKAERFIEEEVYWSTITDIKKSEGEEKESLLTKFKAKIDNMVIMWDKKIIYINDLKTTSKPVSLFKRSFISFHYYRQLAFYHIAAIQFLKQRKVDITDWEVAFRIVAVDNTKYFNVSTFSIDEKWIGKGRQEASTLINQVRWHSFNNEWVLVPEEATQSGIRKILFDEKDEILNALLIE